MSTFHSAGVAVLLSWASSMTIACPLEGGLKALPAEELRRLSLACHKESMRGRMPRAAIMQCSVVYEELKLREFDGDFEGLNRWLTAGTEEP
jgi:hypothetical protein